MKFGPRFTRHLRLLVSAHALLAKTIVLLLPLCLFAACYERDMTVAVGELVPPTFKLDGSGNLVFFSVTEIGTENQRKVPIERDPDKNTILWQISPSGLSSEARVVRRLSPITYGVVPEGWTQKTPASGKPPELVEGRVYQAGGPATNGNGGFSWFKIQEGKVITINAP